MWKGVVVALSLKPTKVGMGLSCFSAGDCLALFVLPSATLQSSEPSGLFLFLLTDTRRCQQHTHTGSIFVARHVQRLLLCSYYFTRRDKSRYKREWCPRPRCSEFVDPPEPSRSSDNISQYVWTRWASCSVGLEQAKWCLFRCFIPRVQRQLIKPLQLSQRKRCFCFWVNRTSFIGLS